VARFEFEIDGYDNPHQWLSEIAPDIGLTLPNSHAPLRGQRATVRALNLLFPEAKVRLFSHTDYPGGRIVTREVKMEMERRVRG
jgi:hypothetical protein